MIRNASLWHFVRSIATHRQLIWQLARREIFARYRGTLLGMVWPILTPLCMLAVYTFVFSIVFKAKWGSSDSPVDFSQFLFCGLIVYAFFAECVGRSATLFVAHPNYITKIVFPLEILPVVAVCSGLFNLLVSTLVLGLFILATKLTLPPTFLFFPLVLAPLCLFVIACALCLASLGVYIRDLEHIVSILLTVLMFLSPIFYPLEAVPAAFRDLLVINPIAPIINATRTVLLLGHQPDWLTLGCYSLVALIAVQISWWLYLRARQGFADLI